MVARYEQRFAPTVGVFRSDVFYNVVRRMKEYLKIMVFPHFQPIRQIPRAQDHFALPGIHGIIKKFPEAGRLLI